MTSTNCPPHIAFIDGMRALAVLAVMLYHLEPSVLPGGFVGVDVFFVISGFVVSASLAGHGRENLAAFIGRFYARRLARLIPALVTMLVCTTLVYVLLVPKAWFNRAADSVGQAAFWGLSNWVLERQEVNYFEPRAELNPFTHTWSLGVEEQFYLIAPLLLFVALRKPAADRRRWGVTLFMAVLAVLSWLACIYVGVTQGARAVFYALPFRFWELAAGVLLFLLLPRVVHLGARFDPKGRRSGAAGLALVTLALLAPHAAAYPYLRAGVAVIGTLLLLGTAHAHPGDPVRGVLASRVAVWIGQRSYALYLWHWPIYVLSRWTVGLTVWPFNAAAVTLSFLLAALSHRLIEQPFRSSARLNAWPPLRRIGLGLMMMAGGWFTAGLMLEQQPRLGLGKVTREAVDWYGSRDLLKTRLAAYRGCEPRAEAVDIDALRGAGKRFEPSGCSRQAEARLFVIGDSHALAYLPMLEQLSAEEGRTVTVLPTLGCSYLDLRDALAHDRDPQCYRVAVAALSVVLAQARPGDIVFLPSLRLARLVELGGARRGGADVFAWTPAELAALARAEADAPRWITPLVDAGLRVILEAPKPVFPSHAFACVETWNRWNPECTPGLRVSRADLERYRAPVMAALNRLAVRYPGITLWDPLPTLCPDPVCDALRGNRPLFFDGDHLSPYGNLLLLQPFRYALREDEAPPP